MTTRSVSALLGIGEGAKQDVLNQLALFGTNRLYVAPGNENRCGQSGTLSTSGRREGQTHDSN